MSVQHVGMTFDDSDVVNARLMFGEDFGINEDCLKIWGLVVAYIDPRGYGSLGKNVGIVGGGRLGASDDFTLFIPAGTVIEVTNIPRSWVDENSLPDGCTCEISYDASSVEVLEQQLADSEARTAALNVQLGRS